METKTETTDPVADQKTVFVVLAPAKVKTVVVMDVPEGPLLFCDLEDLTLKPERGSSYVFNGRLYDVERAIEVLGVYQRASHKSADQQLLSLLNLLTGREQAAIRLASMRNIGKEKTTESGGIILSAALGFTDGAERLVFLRLRQGRFGSETEGMTQLARQAMEGAATAHKAESGDTTK